MAGVASIVWLPKGDIGVAEPNRVIFNLILGYKAHAALTQRRDKQLDGVELFSIKKAHRKNSNESKLNSLSKFWKMQFKRIKTRQKTITFHNYFWICLFFIFLLVFPCSRRFMVIVKIFFWHKSQSFYLHWTWTPFIENQTFSLISSIKPVGTVHPCKNVEWKFVTTCNIFVQLVSFKITYLP